MLAVILLDRHQQPHKQSSASTIDFERMHTDTDSAAPSLTSVYGVYGVFVLLAWGRALDRLWQVPINPILVRRVWCWKRSACVLDASVWGRARCLLCFLKPTQNIRCSIYLHVSLKNIVCTWQFFMETRRAKQAYRSIFCRITGRFHRCHHALHPNHPPPKICILNEKGR